MKKLGCDPEKGVKNNMPQISFNGIGLSLIQLGNTQPVSHL